VKGRLTMLFLCLALLLVPAGLAEAQGYDAECLVALVAEMRLSPLQGEAWLDAVSLGARACRLPLLETDGQWLELPEVGCSVTYIEAANMDYGPTLAVSGPGKEEVSFWLRTPSGEAPDSVEEGFNPGNPGGPAIFYRAWELDEEGVYTAVFERDGRQSAVRFADEGEQPVMIGGLC